MKYTLHEGRQIYRDGKAFVHIVPVGRVFISEVEVFARAVVAAMNDQDVFFTPHAGENFVIETPLTGFISGLRGAAIGAKGDYRAFRTAALALIGDLPEADAAVLEPFCRMVIQPTIPRVEDIMEEMNAIALY